jgi:hypothetical protein
MSIVGLVAILGLNRVSGLPRTISFRHLSWRCSLRGVVAGTYAAVVGVSTRFLRPRYLLCRSSAHRMETERGLLHRADHFDRRPGVQLSRSREVSGLPDAHPTV